MSWRPPVEDPDATRADDDRILCARCMRPIEGSGYSSTDGGLICQDCYDDYEDL